MRVCLSLERKDGGSIDLPLSYNHLVQAAIYNCISRTLANFLHNKGFLVGKRSFKLFVFSRLLGKYSIHRGRISYDGKIALYISSPLERFIYEVSNHMVKKGTINIGGSKLHAVGLSFARSFVPKNEVKIRMLSPVTIYSTLLAPDGRKKTYYYSPYEKEFSELVDMNAKKKYFILNKKELKSELSIKPLRVKEVIMLYKKTVVKGWMGTFMLKGPKSLIRTVYEAGLGAKNSQGFGMFEVVK